MTADAVALEVAVKAAWVKAYGLASWDENRAFDDVGSDSLKILTVLLDIEDALELSIPTTVISVEMTPHELIGVVSRLACEASVAEARDDRPLVFLFAGGMNRDAEAALRTGLANWFRLVAIEASQGAAQAAEQMLHSAPAGGINVLTCRDAAVPAMDAAAQLVRKGYRRGFEFVLDPSQDPRSLPAHIVDAFIASRHDAG